MKTTLYFRQGSSDKVYTCEIVPDGELFRVNFAFGRRGSTLQTGTKTQTPVPLDKAEKIYNKLISEKIAKGYTPGEDGTPYTGGTEEERATGIYPQLLTAIAESEVAKFIASHEHGAQEKYDGKRLMIRKQGDEVVAINRSGLTCGFPEIVRRALVSFKGDNILIDGECVGDRYYVFDILEFEQRDMRIEPYERRHEMLVFLPEPLIQAPLAVTPADKTTLFSRLFEQKKEGIVFKHLNAPYTVGRSGPQYKFKFVQTCTALVVSRNDKRSVGLAMSGVNGDIVQVGNVTIPPNKDIPGPGQLVEIRYLYAYRGGSLYQPFYIGLRDDLSAPDHISTLKFKAEEE